MGIKEMTRDSVQKTVLRYFTVKGSREMEGSWREMWGQGNY